MFKKIKKNVTKIEFTQEVQESAEEVVIDKQIRPRVMFEEDHHEHVVSKRIRLIPNVPSNARAIVHEKEEAHRNYSFSHLMDLEALN